MRRVRQVIQSGEVGDRRLGHRRAKPIAMSYDPAGRKATVRGAPDADSFSIGEPSLDRAIYCSDVIWKAARPPVVHDGSCERFTVARGAAEVGEQHAIAVRREQMKVISKRMTGREERAAVDEHDRGLPARTIGSGEIPSLDRQRIGAPELEMFHIELRPAAQYRIVQMRELSSFALLEISEVQLPRRM